MLKVKEHVAFKISSLRCVVLSNAINEILRLYLIYKKVLCKNRLNILYRSGLPLIFSIFAFCICEGYLINQYIHRLLVWILWIYHIIHYLRKNFPKRLMQDWPTLYTVSKIRIELYWFRYFFKEKYCDFSLYLFLSLLRKK